MNRVENQVNELIEQFKKMNFVEILGFGKLMGVQEKDNFEDFLIEICQSYAAKPRLQRRKLLKLAKQTNKGRIFTEDCREKEN